ncbi:MAG: Crp/Fnr family transcriptional regulator [Deltaproteobacteria bacterium]|nr:Crp/Fnr family transcriptional regulator [Deltaproteobacteria bacterium]
MPDDLAVLRASPVTLGLSDDDLDLLVSRGRVESWPAGAHLAEEGLESPRLGLILAGEAHVLKRGVDGVEHLLARLGPGAVYGELAFLADTASSASVVASGPVRVFSLDRLLVDALIARGDPAAARLSLSLARVLAGRLARANRRIVSLLAGDEGTVESIEALQDIQRHLQWELAEPETPWSGERS